MGPRRPGRRAARWRRARRGGGLMLPRSAVVVARASEAARHGAAGGGAWGAGGGAARRAAPPALALRGIAMAQLGEHGRARELLRRAARGFGHHEELSRARCVVAAAEVALAM